MAKQKAATPIVPSAFGQLMGELRIQKGLSMQKLARQIGISAAYICRLESGERHPSRDIALKLSDILLQGADQLQKDELLVAAGFAPTNYRHFLGRRDVLEIYEAIFSENPENFKNFIALVYSLIRAHEYVRANAVIQEGMKGSHDKVQFSALRAALELAQRNFEQALFFQKEALQAFSQDKKKTVLSLSQVDLLLSLGVIYFEKANHNIAAWVQVSGPMKPSQGERIPDHVFDTLNQAKEAFLMALEQAPHDIYILDELARVHFTWAYLLPESEAFDFWQEAALAFEKTVTSPQKAVLGSQALLQSTAFLALSYSKLARFDKAWFTLSIMEACIPNYWLIHYMKACYFGLRLKHSQNATPSNLLLSSALDALEQAISISDPHNQAAQEALYEPDLALVRQWLPERFARVLQGDVS
ncbi:MAG: helix-turn-helix domain-containing protein [Candidatus Sericytochromatia bacterium]